MGRKKKEETSGDFVDEVDFDVEENNFTSHNVPDNMKDLNKSFITDSKEDKELEESLLDAFNDYLKNENDIDLSDKDGIIIPSGVDLLDAVLGGGILNKFTMLVGMPGCGKSALACKFLAQGQKIWGANKFLSVYIDSEQTQTPARLAQLGAKKARIIQEDVTVEKVFKVIDTIKKFKEKNKDLMDIPSAVVWDSIVTTPTDATLEEEDPNKVTGLRARILSHALPKCVNTLNKYNIALIAVNQLRDEINIGPMRKAADLKWLNDVKIPGGKAVLFNAAQLLLMKSSSDLKSGDNDMKYGFRGNIVRVKAIKNKLFTPNVEVQIVLSHSNGFSNFWTNYEMMNEYKKVTGSAWKTLASMPEIKFRQVEAIDTYKNNSEFRKQFDKEVKELLENEYIKKYEIKENPYEEVF